MNDFTASNGYVVSDTALDAESTRVVVRDKSGENTLAVGYVSGNDYLDGTDMQALREFFQAEEDARLGRWRWPENPQWVLYPDEDGDVVALDESTGQSTSLLTRLTVGKFPNAQGCPAARAYFDAHPESKPWHDAKPGEVWVLTHVKGETGAFVVDGDKFESGSWSLPLDGPSITAGKRIYPEVSA